MVHELRIDGPTAGLGELFRFDEDREGTTYPYLMSWLGEHEQESDMALYATDPLQQVVGPGICRATYGGFLLTSPPGRLFDVWRDPDYRGTASKPEVLLMAAVDEGLGAGFLGAQDLDGLGELLGIPDDVLVVGIVTIGHPLPDQPAGSARRGRRAAAEVTHRERWGR